MSLLPYQKRPPTQWTGCEINRMINNTPDIQPGNFSITDLAYSGQYNAGIVSRSLNSPRHGFETSCQKINHSLEKDQYYGISAFSMKATSYRFSYHGRIPDYNESLPLKITICMTTSGSSYSGQVDTV